MLSRKKLAGRVAGIFLVSMASLMSAGPAHAGQNFLEDSGLKYSTKCGKFWPSSGMFQTMRDGDEFSAKLVFKLTEGQKKSLLCVSDFLELDFRLFGFKAPSEWDNYTTSSNIPGAVHDTAKDDSGNGVTPGLTGIKVSDLVPNREYSATVSFSLPLVNDSLGPRVSFEWVPSYWAASPAEKSVCHVLGGGTPNMCVFGTDARVYLSHGYNNKVSLPFDGYRFWEFKS